MSRLVLDSLGPYGEVRCSTVKFLNFGTPEIFAVINLKYKQRCQTLRYFVKMVQIEKQTVQEQSDLGLHYLPRPICWTTYGHYSNKELALAFGISLAFSRLGSVLNFLLTQNVEACVGLTWTLWGGRKYSLTFTFKRRKIC